MASTTKLAGQQQGTNQFWSQLREVEKLPDWLVAAKQPEKVMAGLSRVIPEFASGEILLHSCDPGHLRFKNDFWTGRYDLTVSGPNGAGDRVVALHGTLLPPGLEPTQQALSEGAFETEAWHAFIPELHLDLRMQEPEKVLAALDFLTDPEKACQFLEENIQLGSPVYRDLRIRSCQPQVMRYNPGSRCTIRYHLEFPQGVPGAQSWPDLVVAKTHHGNKGQTAYESMKAIWDSPLGSSQTVKVAEPLAYNADMKVLVQGPVREEKTLKELLWSAFETNTPESLDELDLYLRKTAAGLAELHRSGIQMGAVHSWGDDLAELRERFDSLSSAVPWLSSSVAPALDRLEALSNGVPADSTAPSHGTFRPAQVLIYRGEIGFIDFDSFCQAEPGLDLGVFTSAMKSITLIHPQEEKDQRPWDSGDRPFRQARLNQVKSFREKFLDEYGRFMDFSRERVALWEALDLMMLVLHSWIKVKPERLKAGMFLLEDHLRDLGL